MEILNYIDLSDQKIEKVKEKRHFDKTLFSHVSARITAIPIDTIIDDIFIYLGKNIRVLATVMLVLATLSLVFNAVRLVIESRIVITLPTKSIVQYRVLSPSWCTGQPVSLIILSAKWTQDIK